MAIQTYIQGETRALDRELFCAVGPALADQAVHDDLGMAVISRPGDIWHVTLAKDGVLAGFAVTRPLKSRKAAHIRFLYADKRHRNARDSLLKEIIKLAGEKKWTSLSTRDRANSMIWQRFDFAVATEPQKRRGAFVRWVLSLGDNAS